MSALCALVWAIPHSIVHVQHRLQTISPQRVIRGECDEDKDLALVARRTVLFSGLQEKKAVGALLMVLVVSMQPPPPFVLHCRKLAYLVSSVVRCLTVYRLSFVLAVMS